MNYLDVSQIIEWTLIILAFFFSIVSLVFFFKILSKFDDFKLDMFEYIKENGEMRLKMQNQIDKNVKFMRSLKVHQGYDKKTYNKKIHDKKDIG
jgi:hypothetical protein